MKLSSDITEYAVWPFKILWKSVVCPFVGFLDQHDGSITALATIVIAFLTFNYVNYSRKQWDTMQQQLDLSQRPWVEAKLEITSPLVFDHNRWRLEASLASYNHGQSVALNVLSWNDMFPVNWETGFGLADGMVRRQ